MYVSYFSSIHCKYVRWDYDGILKTDAAKITIANYYYRVYQRSCPKRCGPPLADRMATLRGHFFSKWANFRGHLQRVNFCGHSNGHFLMVITNSADTDGQPMQGVRG